MFKFINQPSAMETGILDNLIYYAPYIFIIISILVNLKIFARTDEIKELKAEVMTYAVEHFVTKDTYSSNHKALQDQMLQIHQDISDVKNILIGIVNSKNQRN